MLPGSEQRKKKNSSKVNLTISFVLHALVVVVLLYFAARSGFLGHQLQKITVQLVKEQPKPKPPPPPPKVEPPKVETPKVVEAPKIVEAPRAVAPPSQPVVAPPATELPSFDFDGGKAVETSSDPVQIYKGALEYAFHSQWDRPNNMADDTFVAEVQVSVARDGEISNPRWKRGSGNQIWDDSVRKAVAAVKSMNRPPPTNFPPSITVRFDVQEQTDDNSVLQ